MEIRYLSEFVALAEYKSYSRVAEELFVSQPSLSKHIKALEQELGGVLFDRNTRSVTLSPFGEMFLPHAAKIAAEQEKYLNAVRNYKRYETASFSIGVIRNMQCYNVVRYIVEFKKRYPDCIVNVLEVEDHKLKKLLETGQVNMITTAFPESVTISHSMELMGVETEFVEAGKGRMMAVLPQKMPERYDRGIELREAAEHPLIVPDQSSLFSRMLQTALKSEELDPEIIYEGSSAGCFDFTREGLGISLQAEEVVKARVYEGARVVPLMPTLAYRYGLLHRSRDVLNQWEKTFIDFIGEVVR